MPAVEAVFMKCSSQRQLCDLTDHSGHVLTVEPYMIFTGPKGRKCLRGYQIAPVPEPGVSPWISPELASIQSATPREEKFEMRKEYDPFDKQKFPMVHFSLPNVGGYQRWADAPKPRDKTLIKKGSDY